MTNSEHRPTEIEALQRLLDCHGADRTRWPAPERLRFAALLTENAEARRMLSEAQALDRLLDRAPVASAARLESLADRICAAARIETQDRPTYAAPRRAGGLTRDSGWIGYARPALKSAPWQAAGLLAASLVFGLLIGTGGIAQGTVEPIAAAFGIEDSSDVAVLANDGDTAVLSDEDLI